MNRSFSLYLDFLRCVAALTVFAAHLMHTQFRSFSQETAIAFDYAVDAVMLFFVISGFVIAYAASHRDRHMPAFLFNRLTRLGSVAVPAIALTYLADSIGFAVRPELYSKVFKGDDDTLVTLFQGFSLTNEWAWGTAQIGSNIPLWSLSYEWAYYLLFAVAFWMRGWRSILLLAILIPMIGINVILLLPAWLLGACAWRWSTIAAPHRPVLHLVLAALMILTYFGLKHVGADILLEAVGTQMFVIVSDQPLGRSSEFLFGTICALLLALHLILVARACAASNMVWPTAVARLVRWFAGASFSIYAVHFPILLLAAALIPEEITGNYRAVWLTVIVLSLCLIFAACFERPLPRLRTALRTLFQARGA